MKTCCFVGPIDLSEEEQNAVTASVFEHASRLVEEEGITHFFCTDVRGFNLAAARAIIELHKGNPLVQLGLELPNWGQDSLISGLFNWFKIVANDICISAEPRLDEIVAESDVCMCASGVISAHVRNKKLRVIEI